MAEFAIGDHVVVVRPLPGCPPVGTTGRVLGIEPATSLQIQWDGARVGAPLVHEGRSYHYRGSYWTSQFEKVPSMGFDLIDEAF